MKIQSYCVNGRDGDDFVNGEPVPCTGNLLVIIGEVGNGLNITINEDGIGWQMVKDDHGDSYVEKSKWIDFAEFVPGFKHVPPQELSAEQINAAAPDLLEALKYCQKWFEKHAPKADTLLGRPAELPMLTTVKAAIAKATKEAT